MTVTLGSRTEITLDVFVRVAWLGEPIKVSAAALERVEAARVSFRRLLGRAEAEIYGVTTGYGDRAHLRLTREQRLHQPSTAAHRNASYGNQLPERIARGIVLARLANFIDGHAAASSRLVTAVAGLLDPDRPPLPAIPFEGNGGSGEILALGHLFSELLESGSLGEKEGLALINGSPCGAALAADAALSAGGSLALSFQVFALSVEAMRAPLDAYDEALDALWGDNHDALALRRLRVLLRGASTDRSRHPAPVSYRILPRVLGEAERCRATIEHAAEVSLSSVTDNPVYLEPSAAAPEHPDGRVISTGGFHNTAASAALHRLAVCWAELSQLAERQIEQLVHKAGPYHAVDNALLEDDKLIHLLLMVAVGYAEAARNAAQPVTLLRAGPGQQDVASAVFVAWTREEAAARYLRALLALLAAAASHRLPLEGDLAPALVPLLAGIRTRFPPLIRRRGYGHDLANLEEYFGTIATDWAVQGR